MNALPKRALVSVSDKTGLADFAAGLAQLGFEIVSTGGTRRFLEENGVPVIDISSYTGFPEIMEGRVKTLHPKVHGAILGRPDLPGDAAAIHDHGIVPFQVVVCNLYPFEKTVAKPGVSLEEAIEQIDVGGPSMVRAAAKNHAYVAVVTDSAQYSAVLEQLRAGRLSPEFRRQLARAAFERTAAYDRAIADYLNAQTFGDDEDRRFPARLSIQLNRAARLRYGENPHQDAAMYVEPDAPPSTLARAEILHGKELSYNNLLDLDSALELVREFAEPAAVVIKHNNPCGCALGQTLSEAFAKAHAGDPVSAFGSVVGFNRPLDAVTADLMTQPDRFIEAVIAPSYEPAAFEILSKRPKWAKNVRLLTCAAMCDPRPGTLEYRSISGGLLVQDRDKAEFDHASRPSVGEAEEAEWRVVTRRSPSPSQLADLKFAWLVAKRVKSNAIVFVGDRSLVGVGAGQMSRVDSVRLACEKAGDRSRGAVMASDAFFPFRDGIDAAAPAGIVAVVQPGGSRNDNDVIAACDELGLAMVLTGRRHFRH
ncbi:MAG TPA: bifunctional phosphoribosylaminoimidazolecarboxamide formyltransferase/IMP cyclohydrolase [Planctomycetaceae bacterium]|jgi:phosphoribosylaminoimidazolecarboxamide formyltransferase/IMP cyclohydrolase|nr:bifunctional phosphoribosylaminoimidazolecarboxamide formyltransferase/IMP cyclohydrolase [Planctomycetaceae bacterium]